MPDVYVVCQTPACQQTYLISSLVTTRESANNIKCKKCNGVVTDEHGFGNISQNPTVIPVVDIEQLNRNNKRRLERKREELEELKAEIAELEKQEAEGVY